MTRDELVKLIVDASNRNPFPEAEDIADRLTEAGFRNVVTHKEIDRAASVLYVDLSAYPYDAKLRIITKVVAVLGFVVEGEHD